MLTTNCVASNLTVSDNNRESNTDRKLNDIKTTI